RPRYWVSSVSFDERRDQSWTRGYFFAFRGISNTTTNARTAISSIIPHYPLTKSAPSILFPGDVPGKEIAAFAAMWASFAFDYLCRQKVGGSHLNLFIVEQFVVLPRDAIWSQAGWCQETTLLSWLLPRVLELTCTTWDLVSFAMDCEWLGPPFRWDDDRRF